MTGSATAADRGERAAAEAVWTVGAVADRLGVSPSTLRTWSRRYGIGPDGHRPGSHRRYTGADLAELETMRRLVDQGMALTAAAEVARAGRTDVPGEPWAARIDHLMAAARRLDATAATATVTAGLQHHGVVATWDELCRPAITGLTEEDGYDGCVDVVLLLQWSIATALRQLPGPGPAPLAGPVLLAGADGEHHTLPLEALRAALSERRVDARMLGPAVPDFAVLAATATMQPVTVVIWAQTTATAAPALVRTIGEQVTTVVAAGPGWEGTPLRRGVHRANSLSDALRACGVTEVEPVG